MKQLILLANALVIFADILVWKVWIDKPIDLYLFYSILLAVLTVMLWIATIKTWNSFTRLK